MTLRERLKSWIDIDGAQHQLGLCLGVISEELDFRTEIKHIFWSAHPIGDMLYDTLIFLEGRGLIEMRDHEDFGLQCKWID